MKKMIAKMIMINLFLAIFIQNTSEAENAIPALAEIHVTVENTLKIARKDEVIEMDWNALNQRNTQVMTGTFIVVNSATGEQYPYQIINDGAGKPAKLLVQVNLAAQAKISLDIKKGTPTGYKVKTFGRYVPERLDDFAWENDKIAFRMYGPALQATGEASSGIDVWVKRTSEMVIDRWYKGDNYHIDHGEGMDCYTVGKSLGSGGIAPFAGGKLYYSKNWVTYKVICTGALRTEFELTYQPWSFNGNEISETKRITLNAGSQLNLVEVTYKTKVLDTIPVAIGIVKRKQEGVMLLNEKMKFISYWEPESEKYGTTGVGLVVPGHLGMAEVENHLVAFMNAVNNKPIKYYQGACWDRAGEITNETEWTNYLQEFALKVQSPLIITF
jgi:hypothetical protein